MPQASDSSESESAACALNVKKSSSNMQNKAEPISRRHALNVRKK